MTETTYTWETTAAQISEWFRHETPRADTEQDILEIFIAAPHKVLGEAQRIRDEISRGADIRSGWAVLRRRLYDRTGPSPSVTATDQRDRAKAVNAAERWIHNAGLYIDDEREVEDELFGTGWGERQTLKPWADDSGLRARLLELWRKERKRGERAERESLAYQERLRQSRQPAKPAPTAEAA